MAVLGAVLFVLWSLVRTSAIYEGGLLAVCAIAGALAFFCDSRMLPTEDTELLPVTWRGIDKANGHGRILKIVC